MDEILTQQPIPTRSLADMLKGREMPTLSKREIFEFEDLGKEIMEYTGWKGNKIFPLFYDIRYNERKIRDAFIAYKKGNVKTFRYFMGILKNTK